MIYFDHAATTPISKNVQEVMYHMQQKLYGNPSSIHQAGREAKFHLEEARHTIASSIHANGGELFFTSGGTEANNLAIIGAALANKHKGTHIITTSQEHHAVLHVMAYLETIGFSVTYIQADESGRILTKDVKEAIQADTILISIMMVNNETGVIQPIAEIANMIQDTEIIFHTDAVQAYGTASIDVQNLGVHLLTTSAHKINGPKGVGFLYKRASVKLDPLLFGGNQENGLRAGTENLIGILGFESAVKELIEQREERKRKMTASKNYFIEQLTKAQIPFEVNGDIEISMPHIVNIYFPWVKNDILLTNLDLAQIAVSSGSACSAGTIEPSHVLIAMFGNESERIYQSIRISFGHDHTPKQIDTLVNALQKTYVKLKKRNEE